MHWFHWAEQGELKPLAWSFGEEILTKNAADLMMGLTMFAFHQPQRTFKIYKSEPQVSQVWDSLVY